MAESRTEGRLTTLLDNDVLDRLRRLRIGAFRRFTNRSRGEHLAGRGGTSTDFSDYRDYAPGDDMRFVDWNIFARLHRPYLKLYHQEEELNVVLLVDASSSMTYEGKFDRARSLACAFGVLGLMGNEKVCAYAFNARGAAPSKLAPCKGRASRIKLFAFLEGLLPGGDGPLEDGLGQFLKQHVGRGVAVILSDFMTFGDLRRSMNLLFSAGLETFGIQILGASEIDPELSGDVRLIDCETASMLDVTAGADILAIYREYREAFERDVEKLCRERGGRFISLDSQTPIRDVLFDTLRRRGWIL